MRRALIALIAVLPASALAVGSLTFTPSGPLNVAQCKGTQSSDPPLEESQKVTLTWTVQTPTGGTAFSAGGSYVVYASPDPIKAEQWDGTGTTSCTDPQTDGATRPLAIAHNDTIPNGSATQSFDFATGAIATASGDGPGCSGTTEQTIHVCVEWKNSSGSPSGWATATMVFNPITPTGAPSNVQVEGGDRRVHVTSCSPGAGATKYIARASGGDLTTPKYSNVSSCDDLRIGGLTNGTEYTVVVFGLNSANNVGPASTEVRATAIPTDDFWQHYDGRDSGGCATGAGAAGLLGALSILALTLVVRRRKS